MEKYGCNRLEEITTRIKELEKINFKTASESSELQDLIATKEELSQQND